MYALGRRFSVLEWTPAAVDQRLILISLLVKLGASAAISAALVRSWEFHSRLFNEKRSARDTALLTFFISVPYALGVQVRYMVSNFAAADLAFEGCLIMGAIGGRYAGLLGGALCAVPAVIHGEYLTLPFNLLAGFVSGVVRDVADREDIWTFSPFIDLTIFRWIRRNLPRPRMDWQIAFFVLIVLLQFGRMQLAQRFPRGLFAIYSERPWIFIAIMATTIACVAIPLKIWNNTRIELKLEEQTRLLLQARLDALQSQINPHFLFNTLNSISSLVRVDPDTARELIVKLANILRSLLRKHDAFTPLSEEFDFIDDYLNIEVVRFGRDKLRVYKDVNPDTLDYLVPSMILQPLVENSIKHGLAPKLDGGTITLRSRLHGERLMLEVEDDGVGMLKEGLWAPPREGRDTSQGGIGMNNVAERLKVLYGDAGKIIVAVPGSGDGTRITVELPVLHEDDTRTAAEMIYAARSRTRA
jgi:two-component system LytT family sensor kinase